MNASNKIENQFANYKEKQINYLKSIFNVNKMQIAIKHKKLWIV